MDIKKIVEEILLTLLVYQDFFPKKYENEIDELITLLEKLDKKVEKNE